MTTPPERPQAAVEIDESRWPLVLVTLRGIAQDSEIGAALEAMGRIVSRDERLVTVLDAERLSALPMVQRRMHAAWRRRHEEHLRRNVLGSAFVINSSAVRAVFTAILWTAPLPQPYHLAATRDDADRWALEKLRTAGLSVRRAR